MLEVVLHFYTNISSKKSRDCSLLIQHKMKDIILLSFDTWVVVEFPKIRVCWL